MYVYVCVCVYVYVYASATQADILGYGWRAPYVLAALPGILLAGLLATTVQVPHRTAPYVNSLSQAQKIQPI